MDKIAQELVKLAKELTAGYAIMFEIERQGGDLFCFIPQPDGVEVSKYINELKDIEKHLIAECNKVVDHLGREYDREAISGSTEITFRGNPRLSIYIDFMAEMEPEDMRNLRSDLKKMNIQ